MKRLDPAPGQRGSVLLAVVLALSLAAAVAFVLNREGSLGAATAAGEREAASALYVAEAGLAHMRWQLAQDASCTGYAGIPATPFGAGGYSAVVSPSDGSPVRVTATATLASGPGRTLSRVLPVYGGSKLYSNRIGSGQRDTYLHNLTPNTQHDDEAMLAVRNQGGEIAHALVAFDLGDLYGQPVHVLDASLELYGGATSSTRVDLHRVTTYWKPDKSSWVERDHDDPWLAVGGDYDPEPAASAIVLGPAYHAWDATELVRGWLSGIFPNEGVLLRAPLGTSGPGVAFQSGDGPVSSQHPQLVVTYACECGRDCSLHPLCPAFAPDARVSSFSTEPHGPEGHTFGLAYLPEGTQLDGVPAPEGGAWVGGDDDSELFLMLDMAGSLLDHGLGAPRRISGLTFVASGSKAGKLAAVLENQDDEISYIDPDDGSISVVQLREGLDVVKVRDPRGIDFVQYTDGGLYAEHLAILGDEDQTIYLVKQDGKLQHTIDISLLAGLGTSLAHLPGTDLFLVTDPERDVAGLVDLDGNVQRSWRPSALGLLRPASAAIHPESCEMVVGNDGDGADFGPDEVATLAAVADPAPPPLLILALPMTADTYIRSDESSNHGDANTLSVGTLDGDDYHALLKADLSLVPAGISIDAARLRLNLKRTTGDDVVATPPIQGGSDQTYVLVVVTKNNEDVPSVSGGDLVWTERKEQCGIQQDTGVRVFTAQGSPAEPFRVQLGLATMEDRYAVLLRYSGVAAFEDPTGENAKGENENCAGGSDTSIARLTLSSTQAGSHHVLGVASADKDVDSATPGWTLHGDTEDPPRSHVYSKPFPAPATETFEATLSGNTRKWATAGLVLAPAPGGITLEESVAGWEEVPEAVRVDVHRVDQGWTEIGAEWDLADAATPWSGGGGGTYQATPTASNTVDGAEGWYEWDVTALVQEWVDGFSPSHGFVLVPVAAQATELEFHSRDENKRYLRPILEVTFSAE